MNRIQWVFNGNSNFFTLRKDCLIELLSRDSIESYALILASLYVITFRHFGNEMYVVTFKGKKVATVYNKKGQSKGTIEFSDKHALKYNYNENRGLALFYKYVEDDAMIYKYCNKTLQPELSLRIGKFMNSLDIESILLLIAIGKLMFDSTICSSIKKNTAFKLNSLSDCQINLS